MLFKKNYHYLVAGLPDMLLDEGRSKATVSFFKSEFMQELPPEDYALVQYLFLKLDNTNLLNLLQKKNSPFLELGNYSRDLLEEQIKEPDNRILPYLQSFILKFKSGEQDNTAISWETELDNDFFDFLKTTKNDFLRSWFELKLNFQNATTALTCRDHKLPIEDQLVGKNTITEHILRSNSRDFGLSQDFPEIERILTSWESDTIIEREKALDLIRWEWIDEHVFFHYFTIERLLGFLIQLEMVERWIRLDVETGKQMFNEMLRKLGEGYKLPKEFDLVYI